MIYLGIHNSWQSGAALIVDGKIIGAVTEERFNRIKNYHGMPINSINYLLGLKKLKLKVNTKYDNKKPDGVSRKVLDINLARKYGWKSKISLEKGFDITYKDFEKNYKKKQ